MQAPDRLRAEPWPPDDTEESVAGTVLHQTTIINLRWGINEAAHGARDGRRMLREGEVAAALARQQVEMETIARQAAEIEELRRRLRELEGGP